MILLHESSFYVAGIIQELLIAALQCSLFFVVSFLFKACLKVKSFFFFEGEKLLLIESLIFFALFLFSCSLSHVVASNCGL